MKLGDRGNTVLFSPRESKDLTYLMRIKGPEKTTFEIWRSSRDNSVYFPGNHALRCGATQVFCLPKVMLSDTDRVFWGIFIPEGVDPIKVFEWLATSYFNLDKIQVLLDEEPATGLIRLSDHVEMSENSAALFSLKIPQPGCDFGCESAMDNACRAGTGNAIGGPQ